MKTMNFTDCLHEFIEGRNAHVGCQKGKKRKSNKF
jgi:hypothetical protein